MNHICIFILLLAQLVFTSFGQVRVLCVGSDGHISLEQIHDLCNQTPEQNQNLTAIQDTCEINQTAQFTASDTVLPDPCNDVPLPINSTQIASRDLAQDILFLPAEAPLPWANHLLPVTLDASTFSHWAFDPRTSPHRRQTSRVLASIILTI